ncbi:hypothetical protein A3J32_01165 [Candidatus Saccharibacteria bacterium RIFCSPLOWO2_02_FULL_46_7]|nr:MAG: hypothetical protein A3J32_01165 [Candidatus Saccharibacteria bacterium RIFCSPLOWO2_02_FULL_46_7]
MPKKEIEIAEIGPVLLAKRTGMRNIRISVLANGTIRVNLPRWTSFRTAERFAVKHSDWIMRQKSKVKSVVIKPGDRIGRLAKVKFEQREAGRTVIKVEANQIIVTSVLAWNSRELQKKLQLAAEASLKMQAPDILPNRVDRLSKITNLKFNKLRIRKMTSRWGSCSASGNISLSLFLVQLPDELMDYVILHELAHTKHMSHNPNFWQLMESLEPNTQAFRKQLRRIGPALRPISNY